MTLKPIRSDDISSPHGFFTRQGGVSTGVYAGLNCGPGSRDEPAAVQENRRLAAETLGASALISLHQAHTARAVIVTGPFEGDLPKADAMATNTPGIALGVLTADCAPVLFEDAEAGVIGGAHAGWRGALGGVTDAAVEAMESLGAKRSRIRAVIGPVISQRAYEVGPEFMDEFMADDMENSRFFAAGAGDRMQFDLPSYLLTRLRAAGLASAAWSGHCTWSDEEKFFSYRRGRQLGEADYGRLLAGICLERG